VLTYGVASWVIANGNVVQNLWVRVKRGVHEPDRGLASLETLLVDARKDGCECRRRGRCAADEGGSALVVDNDVVANGTVSMLLVTCLVPIHMA
jgi:hypothetical protein